jgi:O-antigen/teichoic acid export membrane protein
MFTSVVGAVLGFIFWLIVARVYNDSDVGLAVALVSASGLIIVVSKFGFDSSIIRYMSKEKDKNAFINTCQTVTGISIIIISVFYLLGTDIWSPGLKFVTSSYIYIFAFIIYNVVSGLYILQSNIFIALRDTKYSFFQETINGLLKIPLPLILLPIFAAFAIFGSWLISTTIALFISIFLFSKKILPSYVPFPSIKKQKIKKIFNFSIANYMVGLFGGTLTYILPLVILNFLTSADTAYFYIAFSIVNILFVIPTAFSMSLYAEGSHEEKEFLTNLKKSLKLAYILLVVGIIGIVIFGPYLLLLFGKNYSSGGYVLLSLLAISSLFIVLNWSYNAYLRINFKMKELFAIQFFVTVGTILFSYFTFKFLAMGLEGIGFSYLIFQGIMSGYVLLRLRRIMS